MAITQENRILRINNQDHQVLGCLSQAFESAVRLLVSDRNGDTVEVEAEFEERDAETGTLIYSLLNRELLTKFTDQPLVKAGGGLQ